MDSPDEIGHMQAGIRRLVLQVSRGGRVLRNSSPSVLLGLLCAGAFGQIISVYAGISAAGAVASIEVLSSVGGNVLADILTNAIDHLRHTGKKHVPPQNELEAEVARQIQQVLDVGDVRAEKLRAEIGAVLAQINAGETALQAAIESENTQLREDLIAALGVLGADFAELGFMFTELSQAAEKIQRGVDRENARSGLILRHLSRQSTEIRLAREQLADTKFSVP